MLLVMAGLDPATNAAGRRIIRQGRGGLYHVGGRVKPGHDVGTA